MNDRIMTLHPESDKVGVNIETQKYNQMKDTIISALEEKGELSFGELTQATKQELKGKFDGSIGWYTTTVKLDLEARNVIKCDRSQSPQKIALA